MAHLGPMYGNGMPHLFPQYQMPMWPQSPPNMGFPPKTSTPPTPKTDQTQETPKPTQSPPKKTPPKQPAKQSPTTPTQPQEEVPIHQVRLSRKNTTVTNGLRDLESKATPKYTLPPMPLKVGTVRYEIESLFGHIFQGDVSPPIQSCLMSISAFFWTKDYSNA